MRLDRYLANMGQGSRQAVRLLVKKGQVRVNGKICRQTATQIKDTDQVTINQQTIAYQEFGYYLLNKPADVLTATKDQKQATVLDLLPKNLPHYQDLAPVGRLDRDTTGLLLITNDGQLAHRLLQPKYHVAKTYQAVVAGEVKPELVAVFAKGVELADFTTQPAQLVIQNYDATKKQSLVQLTIAEGKYHQVKRMLKAFGHEVLSLKRLSFGPLTLPAELAAGEYRELTAAEVTALQIASGTGNK
jgi:pseudouridine synthase